MALAVRRVRTPIDFEQTICDVHYRTNWISPPANFEADIRHALDEIFGDLQYIDRDEPGLVSTYLDAIAEPLEELQQLGIQLVAVTTTGTYVSPGVANTEEIRMPMVATHYFVAPNPCFFSVEGKAPYVHKLGVDCEVGHKQIIRQDTKVKIWGVPAARLEPISEEKLRELSATIISQGENLDQESVVRQLSGPSGPEKLRELLTLAALILDFEHNVPLCEICRMQGS